MTALDRGIDTGQIPKLLAPRVSQRLRNIELALLLAAFAISGLAILFVQFGALGRTDIHPFGLCLILVTLIVLLHITMRFVAPQSDALILPIVVVLNGLGIAEIYRIDLHLKSLGWDALATKQIAWTALAVGAAVAVLLLVRNTRVLQRFTYTAGLFAVILLLLPVLPVIGTSINGARVWIQIGTLTFQPGEIAKIALAIFFAGYLVSHRESLSMVGRRFLGMRLPQVATWDRLSLSGFCPWV